MKQNCGHKACLHPTLLQGTINCPSCIGMSHSIAIQNQVATLMAIAIQTSRNNSKTAAHQLLQGSLRYPFSFGRTNFPKPKHRNYFVELIEIVQDRQIAGEDHWTVVVQSMEAVLQILPLTFNCSRHRNTS
jgi:hypothetical protein